MPRKKQAARRPRLDTILSAVSLTDLRAALDRRRAREQEHLATLAKTRATLVKELAALDRVITDIEETVQTLSGGQDTRGAGRPSKEAVAKPAKTVAKKRRGRPPGKSATKKTARAPKAGRKPSHCDLAADVLKESGKAMHQRDIAARLIADKGVKTKSKVFERSLGLALSQDSKRFKKVNRAVYALR